MIWIDVRDERRPSPGQPVLVVYNNRRLIAEWRNEMCHDFNALGWFECTSQIRLVGVTHWMPLPELPDKTKPGIGLLVIAQDGELVWWGGVNWYSFRTKLTHLVEKWVYRDSQTKKADDATTGAQQ